MPKCLLVLLALLVIISLESMISFGVPVEPEVHTFMPLPLCHWLKKSWRRYSCDGVLIRLFSIQVFPVQNYMIRRGENRKDFDPEGSGER